MKPTFLYIKQHKKTGMLYFGKTTRNPETYSGSGKYWTRHIKYHGIEHVETIWFCLFLDKDSLEEFAISFSNLNSIVSSDNWANLKIENGLDGGSIPELCNFSDQDVIVWKANLRLGWASLKPSKKEEHRKHCQEAAIIRESKKTADQKQEQKRKELETKKQRDKTITDEIYQRKIQTEKSYGDEWRKDVNDKISRSLVGREFSEEHIQKLKGPKQKHLCPHCHRLFAPNMLKRYHGENCKFKSK